MMVDAEKMNENLDAERIEGSSGGGAVKATVNGHGEILALSISKEVVDPEDVEMLEDLVMTAVREALEKADELKTSEQQKLMPAGIPGLPGLF
jgi:nucleoid-associated protein EbfC